MSDTRQSDEQDVGSGGPRGQSGGAAAALRPFVAPAVAVGAVLVAGLVWLLVGSAGTTGGRRPAADAGDPAGSVRAVVKLLKAGETKPSAFEPYFAEKEVAEAVAAAVKAGDFPKKLDIKTIATDAGSDAATVTVLWNMKRPNVEENGSAFLLKLERGRWVITDAQSKDVKEPGAAPSRGATAGGAGSTGTTGGAKRP